MHQTRLPAKVYELLLGADEQGEATLIRHKAFRHTLAVEVASNVYRYPVEAARRAVGGNRESMQTRRLHRSVPSRLRTPCSRPATAPRAGRRGCGSHGVRLSGEGRALRKKSAEVRFPTAGARYPPGVMEGARRGPGLRAASAPPSRGAWCASVRGALFAFASFLARR